MERLERLAIDAVIGAGRTGTFPTIYRLAARIAQVPPGPYANPSSCAIRRSQIAPFRRGFFLIRSAQSESMRRSSASR